MSPANGGRSVSGSSDLPRKSEIRRKPSFEGTALLCLKPTALTGGSRNGDPCSPTNSMMPPRPPARRPPLDETSRLSLARPCRGSPSRCRRRGHQRGPTGAQNRSLRPEAGHTSHSRRPFRGFLGASRRLRSRPREKMFGPAAPAPSTATPRSGSCTGRAASPPDREGQGLWRDHRQGARRARGALMGLPQRQKRALLPVLREDRRGRRLRPLDRCRGHQGA